jgi:hypothetical protein
MSLDDSYTKMVAFVIERLDPSDGVGEGRAIGTSFFVMVPSKTDPGNGWLYAVTARHVVESGRDTWLRVHWSDGHLDELPVKAWTLHPSDDVAVTLMNRIGVDCGWMQIDDFLDVRPQDRRPRLGDRIYFVGLLAIAKAMVDENIPIVRSGTLGRMYQDGMVLRHGQGDSSWITRHEMHLIDCRSYAGFSGSPCFVQFQPIDHLAEPLRMDSTYRDILQPETLLLGLISGHMEELAEPRGTGELANDQMIGTIRFPVNTGVALVTPVEKISECLMDDELVVERARMDADLVSNH